MFFRAGLFRKRKCSRAVEQRYDFANRHGLFTVPRGMMMDRSRYALQPVYFVMFQLSILVRMRGDLQCGMPARAGHGVARIWKALPRLGASGRGVPADRCGWHGQDRGGQDHRPNRRRHLLPTSGGQPVGSHGHPGQRSRELAGKPTRRCGPPWTIRAGGCMMTGAAR